MSNPTTSNVPLTALISILAILLVLLPALIPA
jgi:hypothetical protein